MTASLRLRSLCVTAALAGGGCFDEAKLQTDGAVTDRPAAGDQVTVDVADASTPSDVTTMTADVPAADVPAQDAPVVTDAPSGCTRSRVLITTTDYMRGGYALGSFSPTPSIMALGAMAPDQDHLPIESNCVVYELLRGEDVLAILDTASLPTVARRIPLRMMGGADAGRNQVNPYDVLGVTDTKAYVVQYAVPRLAVVDPTREGEGAVRTLIDLAPLRSPVDMDASGSPEPAAIERSGRYAFVALQNLNGFAPVTQGTVAVIDTTGDVLYDVQGATPEMDGVRLTGRNPVAMQSTPGGSVVVAEAGVLAFAPPQMLDGGIEVVDPASFRASGFRVTESALGGDLSGFVMLGESRGWATVTTLGMGGPQARVVEFDLMSGSVSETVLMTGEIGGIARAPDGTVWVLDRTTGRAGARVFRVNASTGGTEITATPLSTGTLPPNGIAFVP